MKIAVLVILSLGLIFQFIPEALAEGNNIGSVASPGAELSIENPPPAAVQGGADSTIKVVEESGQNRATVVNAETSEETVKVKVTGPLWVSPDENS